MNVSVHIYSDKDDAYNASVNKQLDELREKEKPKISDAQLFEQLVRGTLTLADDASDRMRLSTSVRC